MIIGWTDEEGTHLDILFTRGAYKEEGNYLQRGIKGTDLFVSIMSLAAFGFKIENEKHYSYIAEKLSLEENKTSNKLAELLNGIIKRLKEEYDE